MQNVREINILRYFKMIKLSDGMWKMVKKIHGEYVESQSATLMPSRIYEGYYKLLDLIRGSYRLS